MDHRFSLDRSPRKFTCPQCHRHRRFVRYIDNQTGEFLPEYVGRCDREDNCQYHFTPKMYFAENPSIGITLEDRTAPAPPPPRNLSFIPPEVLRQSLREYDRNNFIRWLHSLFDPALVDEVCELYHVGTSKHWPGATAFWQVDTELKVRQVKVMLYDPGTGRRDKEKGAYFAGKSILKSKGISDPELKQCFFGEHQLSKDTGRTVGIVESEKTAILMSLFTLMGKAPSFLWLATGGKNGCKWTAPEVFEVLAGRTVILYPDLGAFKDWQFNSYHLTECSVTVSDLIEKNATPEDREGGLDIADYFLRIWQREKNRPALTTPPAPPLPSVLIGGNPPEDGHQAAPPLPSVLIGGNPPEDGHQAAPPPPSVLISGNPPEDGHQAAPTPATGQAAPSPAARIETFSRDGQVWQVEINDKGYPVAWDEEPGGSAPSLPAVSLPGIKTRYDQTLGAMIEINPLVGDFVNRFDLAPLG